jgi:uncharacterized cupin superfamily protein
MPEAEIVAGEHGDVPRGEGWYVLNAARAAWQIAPPGFGGADLSFEGDARFADFGFHLGVLSPGEPTGMYHSEDNQEGFLVLSGECLAVVEGEERVLRAWDYLHCPAGTPHILVGGGSGPCVVLGIGSRHADGTVYLPDPVAARHGAAVAAQTESPAEAYADVGTMASGPAPELPRL